MFTMAKIRGASCYGEYLNENLSYSDYIAEENKVRGQWFGKLASELGLIGATAGADDVAFRRLIDGKHPQTELKLTQRQSADAEKSVRIFDFQCGAHKSVSIMALIAGDTRLIEAHNSAVASALGELEKFAARRAGNGLQKHAAITGNVCGARFTHDSSRALDPQLHTHCATFNVTKDRDGKFYALTEWEMVRAIRYAGKVYQNEMAKQCLSLGYELTDEKNEKGIIEGFAIKGVSKELCERFSKRTPQVEAALSEFRKKYGREPSPQEMMEVKRKDRAAKLSSVSKNSVKEYQLSQLSKEELITLKNLFLKSQTNDRKEDLSKVGINSVSDAVRHLFERKSVLTGQEILAESLNNSLGRVNLDSLKHFVNGGAGGLVNIKDGDSPTLLNEFATKDGIRLELWATDFVDRSKNTLKPLYSDIPEVSDWLANEQKNAVRFVLSSHDRVNSIRGVAGAGKTTMLKELNTHLEKKHLELIYLAPTASAVKVLNSEGFTKATTVTDFLVRHENSLMNMKNGLIIVDEAGLQSNKQGAAILKIAEKNNNRVLFVGDSKQHVSVEAGDFLRILERYSKLSSVELVDIRRQRVEEYNTAIRLMAGGNTAAGLEALDRLGWIKEHGASYLSAAANKYLADIVSGKDTICITPTWAENYVITDIVRDGLKNNGLLASGKEVSVYDSFKWTSQQKGALKNYQVGMVLTFTQKAHGFYAGESVTVEKIEGDKLVVNGKQFNPKSSDSFEVSKIRQIELSEGDKILVRMNDKKIGLTNGDILTVQAVSEDGSIKTKQGHSIPPTFRHIAHGYVVTSYKSQGRTHDEDIMACQKADTKTLYVGCSRGRDKCTIFTPSKDDLFGNIPRSSDRKAVLDVISRRSYVMPKTISERFESFKKHFVLLRKKFLSGRGVHHVKNLLANYRRIQVNVSFQKKFMSARGLHYAKNIFGRYKQVQINRSLHQSATKLKAPMSVNNQLQNIQQNRKKI